jgi:diguanylate cyclase (GGDEF)-like protein
MVILTEDGKETRITVSIGVNSTTPKLQTSPDDFMEYADKALYKAKASGRNRVEVYRIGGMRK